MAPPIHLGAWSMAMAAIITFSLNYGEKEESGFVVTGNNILTLFQIAIDSGYLYVHFVYSIHLWAKVQ